MMFAAWESFSEAWNSPSAAMIFARRSRSASAWRAIARCMSTGQLDVLDLDRRDLDAPGLGLLVDDLLQLDVEPLALGEQRVELGLAEHRAQRGLRDLGGGEEEVLDLGDRLVRVDDAEVGDGVDAHGDVVLGDDLLRRHVQRDRSQVDADHLVDERDQQDQAGALLGDQAAEPEDDAALVLAQDPDRRGEDDQDENRDYSDDREGDCQERTP